MEGVIFMHINFYCIIINGSLPKMFVAIFWISSSFSTQYCSSGDVSGDWSPVQYRCTDIQCSLGPAADAWWTVPVVHQVPGAH